MSTPYQSPISEPGENRRTIAPWENLLSCVVILASAAYAVLCIVHIVTLNAIVTIGNQELAGGSPSAATIHAKTSLDGHLNTAVNVAFWAMYLLFIGWMISLNSRFRKAGRGSALRSMTAWKVWRVGVLVSLVLVIVLQTHNTGGSLSTAISDWHHQMVYLGVRAAIGCMYVWCALGMRKAAQSLSTTPSMGIPAQPGWPPVAPTSSSS